MLRAPSPQVGMRDQGGGGGTGPKVGSGELGRLLLLSHRQGAVCGWTPKLGRCWSMPGMSVLQVSLARAIR